MSRHKKSSVPRSASSASTLYGESEVDWFIQDGIEGWFIQGGIQGQVLITAENKLVGHLATVCPAQCLRFKVTDSHVDSETETLKIFNPSRTQKIAYKVKTTSPDFYRVLPHTGIIEPGETAMVTLLLKPDHDGTIHRKALSDKFLVQIIKIDNRVRSHTEIKDQWKTVDKDGSAYMQTRMWCTIDNEEIEAGSRITSMEERTAACITRITSMIGALPNTLTEKQQKEKVKMKKEIEVTHQSLTEEVKVVSAELDDSKKQQEENRKRQDVYFRFVQFHIFMMMMIVLALFVIGYIMASSTEPVDDMALCADNFSFECIFPTLVW